jgi:hypothetical protein
MKHHPALAVAGTRESWHAGSNSECPASPARAYLYDTKFSVVSSFARGPMSRPLPLLLRLAAPLLLGDVREDVLGGRLGHCQLHVSQRPLPVSVLWRSRQPRLSPASRDPAVGAETGVCVR